MKDLFLRMRYCGIHEGVSWLLLVFILASAIRPGVAGPFSRNKTEAPSYAQPAENILIIIADIHRHINDDVYRFPYPVDVTGQNVFRAGAVRLDYYDEMYPGKMEDVVALAKGQVFLKLRAYEEAGGNFQKARESKDPSIRKRAEEGFEQAKKISKVVNQPIDRSALRTYERDMQKKIRDLDDLIEELRKTPYECLAQVEREQAQMQLAEFYVTMRFMQPYSPNDAILQIKRNIEQNKDSKLLFAHHLMLGDLYYDLAKEYTLLRDPEGPDFDLKEFQNFAGSARAEFHIVEQADGYAEKLEGRAKLLALEAFIERVAERAR